MTIVGSKEDLIAQNGHSSVGAKFCVANHTFAGRTRILPNHTTGERVEREYLVRSRYIQDSVAGERRCFEAKGLDGKNPLQLQRGDIRGVDLFEWTVPVA